MSSTDTVPLHPCFFLPIYPNNNISTFHSTFSFSFYRISSSYLSFFTAVYNFSLLSSQIIFFLSYVLTRQVGPTKPFLQWHRNFIQVPSPQSSFDVHRCPPIAKGCRGTCMKFRCHCKNGFVGPTCLVSMYERKNIIWEDRREKLYTAV